MSSQNLWLIIGFAGQACFFMRFFVQWIYSERRKRSVIPTAFWYFSLGGAAILLTYAIHRQDPVFIVGQSTGFLIYTRNLVLLGREKRERAGGRDAGEDQSAGEATTASTDGTE